MDDLATILLVALAVSNCLFLAAFLTRAWVKTAARRRKTPAQDDAHLVIDAAIKAQLTEIQRDIDWLTADRMLETTRDLLDTAPKGSMDGNPEATAAPSRKIGYRQ